MMISEDQALAAVAHLRTNCPEATSAPRDEVPADLLAAAVAAAYLSPDVDVLRIANAAESLRGDPWDSREIASMMLKRMVCDSLR